MTIFYSSNVSNAFCEQLRIDSHLQWFWLFTCCTNERVWTKGFSLWAVYLVLLQCLADYKDLSTLGRPITHGIVWFKHQCRICPSDLCLRIYQDHKQISHCNFYDSHLSQEEHDCKSHTFFITLPFWFYQQYFKHFAQHIPECKGNQNTVLM